MNRRERRKKKNEPTAPKPPADRRLLGCDLDRWAGEGIAAGGRKLALLGRVEMLLLAPGGLVVEARVRGNRPLPYRVEVRVQGSALASRCTCAWEYPAPCKHAVAAVEALRFPLSRRETPQKKRKRAMRRRRPGGGRIVQESRAVGFLVVGEVERHLTRDERTSIARQEELGTRRQRARQERFAVVPVEANGGPPRFDVADRGSPIPLRVTLRGPRAGYPTCTCSDFRENELETCAHVERVRNWYLRKKKQIPTAVVSVWWRPREWAERVPDPLQEIFLFASPGEPSALIDRYFDDEGWLRPPGNGVAPSRWARRALSAARRLARSRGLTADLDPALAPLIREVAGAEALAERLREVETKSQIWREIQAGLGFDLHPYQEEGALFLARRGRAFLADDMGLGKTIQSIAAALLLRRVSGAAKALIVCPASLKYQWRQEIERACGERSVIVEGRPDTRLAAYRAWSAGFLILNYELVLRDLDAILAAGADLVVLDEAQRIKNWDTLTARAVKQLASPHAFVLTGTPLENRLLELQSLVEFLHPRALGPRWRQLPYHAVTEEGGRIIAYEGFDVLRRKLGGYFLRRERKAVLDQLPERTENTFWTAMTPMQQRDYGRQAARLAALLSGKQSLGPAEIRILLQTLTSMRILCNARAQFDWEQHAERLTDPTPPTPAEVRALHSPKLEEFSRVLEDLLDESGTKIVVYSQWQRMLRLAHFVAREPLWNRDLRAEVFHGGLSARARSKMIEAFMNDPEFRVLFSTDAGGLGLNLQEAASIVVHLEVPWNPAILEQRVGRVHRLGQRENVQVLHFVTRGAIEERVRQVVESKRALFDGLLVDGKDRVVLDASRSGSLLQRVRGLIGDTDGK